MGFFDILGKAVAPVAKLAKPVANVLSSTGVLGPIGAGASAVLDLFSNNVSPELTDIFNAEKAEENIDRAYNFQREMNQSQQHFNALEAQKARDFNALEAQKTRDFNSSEAALQRNWQQEMYEQQRDDNREWNDVGAQMQRAMAAGMNPLAFDQGTMSLGNVGSGASASAGAPASSPMASIHPNGAMSLANPHLNPFTQSQTRLNNAQAQSLEDSNKRDEEKHGYEISTMKGNLYLQDLHGQLTKQEIEQAKINLDKSLAEIDYINETINSVFLDNEERKKVLANWERSFEANIRNVEADTDYKIRLTDKTKEEICKILAETTSISQNNVINSIEFEFVKNNKTALVELRHNKEKQEYDLFCGDMKVSQAKNEREYKYQSGTWTGNEYLDGPLKGFTMGLDALSRSLGIGFNLNANNPVLPKK